MESETDRKPEKERKSTRRGRAGLNWRSMKKRKRIMNLVRKRY